MDPFERLVKPKGPFSEKLFEMHKMQIVRFMELNKHFRSLWAVHYFVAYI